MGFACLICYEPFDKGTHHHTDGNKGGGDGHPPEVSATVITKCGHMFHTDCFKRACDGQSKNAWVQKSCPVCKEAFQMQDMIRVKASFYDRIASMRPPVEDILRMNQQVQQEKSELLKRLEASVRQYKQLLREYNQLHNDAEKISQEKEGLQLRVDQLLRVRAIHNSEIDMLKNMIIASSGTNKPEAKVSLSNLELRDAVPNHQARLAYSNDLQGFPVNDMPMLVSNGTASNQKQGHSPGFMYPMVHLDSGSENGGSSYGLRSSAEPGQGTATHTNVNLPIFSKANAPKKSFDNWIPGTGTDKWMGKSLAQHKANSFQLENREYGSSSIAISWANNNEANFYAKTNGEVIPQPKEYALQADADDNSPSPPRIRTISLCESQSFGQTTASSSWENGNFSPGNVDDDPETDDSDKWFEKRSRRRTASKASNSNRTPNSGSRSELPEDRRLYGSYSCSTCNAKWGSSQTLLDKPQICRYCKTEVFPHSQGPILSRRQLEMNVLTMKDNPAKASKK